MPLGPLDSSTRNLFFAYLIIIAMAGLVALLLALFALALNVIRIIGFWRLQTWMSELILASSVTLIVGSVITTVSLHSRLRWG